MDWGDAQRMTARTGAVTWARDLLARDDWVVLDTETTGLGSAAAPVRVAVVAPTGRVLLDTLVRPDRPVEDGAAAVHGLSGADLAEALAFGEVYPHLAQTVAGREIVAYNAPFDRAVLDQACRAAGQSPLPARGWTCAMRQYAAWVGEWSERHGDWRWPRLPGGNHTPVGDGRATLALVRRIAAGEPVEVTGQQSEEAFDDWQSTASDRGRPDSTPPAPSGRIQALFTDPARFRDAEYQRWAQAQRTHDSLAASGRAGYQETARRYGPDFAAHILAEYRRAHPTMPERAMLRVLADLGQEEGWDYYREYKLVPQPPPQPAPDDPRAGDGSGDRWYGTPLYPDFAWPEQKLAVEVYGSAHDSDWLRRRGIVQREERRLATYAQEGWRVVTVTERDLADRPEALRERLRRVLDEPPSLQPPLWVAATEH
ncbi:MAG TPA: exonuclease domain-containing protein [Nitrolancea sp.]|nr:exonuclease domain-containing protein [Nitrolancea sp.]